MRRLPRVRISSTNRLIRIVALSTAGSSILFSNRDTNSKTTVSVSVPAPLRDSYSLQWPIVKEMIRSPSTLTSNLSPYAVGNVQLFLSRIGSVPSEDVNKDASGKFGDGSRSIATAVAMVIPAVVHISVPCSMFQICAIAFLYIYVYECICCLGNCPSRLSVSLLSVGDAKTSGSKKGAGAIIDPDGTILTCAHVLLDSRGKRVTSKGKVDVTLQDGRTFVGTVVNADLHSDIAIVKINSILPLPSAKLGSSSKLRAGDWVVAMGSPLCLQNTVTAGIVSCVDRKSSEMGFGGMLKEYVQIDCALNPGNSGGPLVDLDGEIVGVNVIRLAINGLGFAVPSDSIFKIMEHFKKNGRVVRPWLGMKMLDLNEAIVSQLKDKDPLFPNVNKGVLVFMAFLEEFLCSWHCKSWKIEGFCRAQFRVTPGSPADIAGFHPGDVVIEFQGKPVGSIAEITELMEEQVGMPLKVVVKRAKDTSVPLTVVPEEAIPEL
ncbi:putative protease Do-like 14 isoform X2 [Cornus florida]|uniref:putative protease Do-like 14 isoform X2 n=1 Tax=Cornus florida TaxID=4283 RepID=UPI00289B2A7E|nr:putative protease Do-like 14 isoform X2 [Cornus florida]